MSFEETLNQPTTIYHYTTSTIALEHILPFGELRLSRIKNTNDPFEYKELLLTAFGLGEPYENSDEIFNALHRIDEIRKNEVRMGSFCLNNVDDRNDIEGNVPKLGCLKSRMWSQYGESHMGIALAFDSKILERTIDNSFQKSDFKLYGEITYKPFNPNGEVAINTNIFKGRNIEQYCIDFIKKHSHELLFVKNPDYRDENEYRCLVHSQSEDDLFIEIQDSLIGVIIGDRFPDGLLPSLKYQLDRLEVRCKRATWYNGRPVLFNCSPNNTRLFESWGDMRFQ